MKSFAHKLLAFSCIFALATGCASVTDASLDTQPENTETVTQDQPANTGFGSESTMDVILDKPEN